MKYTHPTEIPMSENLFFDWDGERMYTVSQNVFGDTYPVTWAADDNLYDEVGQLGD